MKKGAIFSAIIGGTFFAIPYIAMDVALLPSTLIAVAAFGAGNLILGDIGKKEVTLGEDSKKTLSETISVARKQNASIYSMMNKIDDVSLVRTISEIHDTADKIIDTISKDPKKQKLANKFFTYYLPSTLNFLIKYDEIENQRLNTEESKEFMNSAEEMMKKISESFKVQLSNLYRSDMIDTDAEMKVFDTMLKTDGIDSNNDFDIK